MIINEPASFRNTSPGIGSPALVEAINFLDTSRFIATSAGTGDFIVLSPMSPMSPLNNYQPNSFVPTLGLYSESRRPSFCLRVIAFHISDHD